MCLPWHLCLCIALLVISSSHYCCQAADFYPPSSRVLNLDASNFEQYVTRASHVSLVEFYAPWCGHCKALKPQYIKAAKSLRGIAQVAAVDANEPANQKLARQYDVEGFPTLKLFIGKASPVNYQGPRTGKAIAQWVKAEIPKHYLTVTAETESEFLASQDDEVPRVILFTSKGNSPLYRSLALKFKGRIVFGEASDKETQLAKNYYVDSYPSLQFLPPHGIPPVIYQGPYNARALNRFLKRFVNESEVADFGDEVVPELPELADDSCFRKYCQHNERTLCVLLFMYQEDKQDHYTDTMRAVEETRSDGLFSYVWVDQEQQPSLLTSFGMEKKSEPQVVVLSAAKKRYAVYEGDLAVRAVSTFLKRIVSGDESTFPINTDSGELPTLGTDTQKCEAKKGSKAKDSESSTAKKQTHNGGVPPGVFLHTITRVNFDRLVQSSTSPWLLLFTSPECKKCGKTLEHWRKAAKQGKNMVKYGTVDCGKQARLCKRFEVSKFPMVKVFAAGKKATKKPTDYTGKRAPSVLHPYALSLLDANLVSKLDVASIQPWFAKDAGHPRVLLFSKKENIPDMFSALSNEFEATLRFGFVSSTDKELCAQFQVTEFPAILLMAAPATAAQQGGLQAHKYQDSLTFDAIAQFLYGAVATPGHQPSVEDKVPEVHYIHSQADFKKGCLDRGGMCLVAMLGPDYMRKYGESKYEDELDLMAENNLKKPVNFLKADRYVQSAFAKVWGLADDGPATVVLFNPRKKRWAGFVGVFDEEHITEFIDAVLAGRIRTSTLRDLPEFVDDPEPENQSLKSEPARKEEL